MSSDDLFVKASVRVKGMHIPAQGRLVLAIVMILLNVTALLAFSAYARAQEDPVRLSLSADTDSVIVSDVVSLTVRIENTSNTILSFGTVTELAEEVRLVPGTIVESTGQTLYAEAEHEIRWTGELGPEGTGTISFEVEVIDLPNISPKCAGNIFNQTHLTTRELPNLQLNAQLILKLTCPDLGDAPDSTNHGGVAMTAYPGPVAGRYPTVFDAATGLPQGPRHRYIKADAWLGQDVTGERDADLLPDQDGVTNLDPAGNIPNRDEKDDGIITLPVKEHCKLTTMDVLVTVVGGVRERYLNVWLDWNRDGDWEDFFNCPNNAGAITAAPEWVVQNYVTTLGNGAHTVTVPAFLAVDLPNVPDDHWLRVTLSEAPAPVSVTSNLADGQGPRTGYRFGETEDYRVELVPPVGPELQIRKTADVLQTVPGGTIEYTIVVQNTGNGPAIGFTVLDPIPTGTTYVAGSLNATAPTPDDSNPAIMKWTGNIPAGGMVTIKFKVTVNPDLECPSKITNTARLLSPKDDPIAEVENVVSIVCLPANSGGDFGDAPDSLSNHHNLPNTAYAAGPVLGRFPTVWGNTPAAEGTGPRHAQHKQYWLGKDVTREMDADLLPDADGITNILNNGAADVADNDRADDGWLNPDVPLPDCRESMLRVRLSAAAAPPAVNRLYLNVWFDGNRDGDWEDTGFCPDLKARSYEWIVQDWAINPASIPAGGFVDIAVPTVLIYNAQPTADAWIRFTLSEDKAVRNPATSLGDGRGPAFPAAFKYGETEDYYRKGTPQGTPGQITIEKKADPAGPVNVGDVIDYSVFVKHNGGSSPATTVMTDMLPAGVSLVSGPTVTEMIPNATPLVATFNPGIGPSGAVIWNGTLSPNALVRIDFRVRVKECVSLLRNVAVAVNTNGQLVQATVETGVNCTPAEPEITLEKSVVVEGSQQQVTDATISPGSTATYYLTLSSNGNTTHSVTISDDLPSGMVATAATSTSGVVNIVNGGQTVTWSGLLGPNTSPVTIKIRVRIEKVECDQQLINIAKWFSGSYSGQSNPVTLTYVCRDLGDAPDSSNHPGAAMTAYPSVPARYPTVFNVAAPERGPRHDLPHAFFLGKRVSAEVEADLGFDSDGVNNIDPANNKADLDQYDDGIDLNSVAFKHCQASTLRVIVTITPQGIAMLPNGTGYLNVWVDSNRDGDWADSFDCPQTATGAPSVAREHIVIDHMVNAAALGAGVHLLAVPTSGAVHWPDALAGQPSWLRVTLGDRPSNKPFTTHGDGRGHDNPFRTGETEDYLLRGQSAQATADVEVRKQGEIYPYHDPATGQQSWIINWIVNYANVGTAPATNVHIIETINPPQTLLAETSIPLIVPTITGNTLDYNVGTLAPGASGVILIRTTLPGNTAPGTVVTNQANATSNNDSNSLNNTGSASVTVPLLAPMIVSPMAGTTCTGTVTIEGWVQPGAVVDIYVDGGLVAAGINTMQHGSGNGDWRHAVTITDGTHEIYAIARAGNMTSDPSPSRVVKVDMNLTWDPISLRFTDELGHSVIPSGRLDESGWSIFLRPGHTYSVSLRVCCSDPNAQVTIKVGDILVTLTDPDGDRIFTGTFTVPEAGRFTGTVTICVTCDLIRICSDGQVTIDPEGTTFNLLTGVPIPGATVSCMQSAASAAGGQPFFQLWPAAQFDQINPQVVGNDGYFSFFTPAGTYRLNVVKSGYQPYVSPDLTVVDAPVHFDVPLTPVLNQAADAQITINNGGFEPAVLVVKPGAVVEWINVGGGLYSTTSITPAVTFDGISAVSFNADNGAWDSGLLGTGESYKRQLNTVGTYTYGDVTKPGLTATIIVKEADTNSKLFLPTVRR
jgi:uncharacterized repeat protein (TIGR01451 family)